METNQFIKFTKKFVFAGIPLRQNLSTEDSAAVVYPAK